MNPPSKDCSHHQDLLQDPNLYPSFKPIEAVGNGREDPNKKKRKKISNRTVGREVPRYKSPITPMKIWEIIESIKFQSVNPNHQLTSASDFPKSRGRRDSSDFYDNFRLHKPWEQLTIIAPVFKSKYKFHYSWAGTFIEYWNIPHLSHGKKKRVFSIVNGCLTGILIMVYYNPHIIWQYNPLYTLNNHQAFFHCSLETQQTNWIPLALRVKSFSEVCNFYL